MTCRSVAYLRVSSEGQVKNGHGLGIQEQGVKAWAKANGHTIVAICSDEGLSGTLDAQDRPGLLRALNMVRSGEATALAPEHCSPYRCPNSGAGRTAVIDGSHAGFRHRPTAP